jgi:hypothetical protein
MPGVGGSSKRPSPEIKSGPRGVVESAADTQADPSTVGPRAVAKPKSGRGLIIASVVLLVLSAAGAGLYFTGYLNP